MMKTLCALVVCLMAGTLFASTFVKESLNWHRDYDWATYDREAKTYYKYLPMNEEVSDLFDKLDRRFDYECQMKERNLRQFFDSGTVVIAVYSMKDCKQTGKNPNW